MIKLAIIGLPLLLGAISTPVVENETSQVNEVSSRVQPKKVVYDETNEAVILSASETTYSFTNLYQGVVDQEYVYNNFGLIYNGSLYSYGDTTNYYVSYSTSDNSAQIYFMLDYIEYNLSDLPQYNYFFFDGSGDSLLSSDLEVNIQSDYYPVIKSAIEQDIIENSQTMPTISQMFGVVADALQSFATTLGSAFTSVTALFWDSAAGAPTFLGLLSLAVLGAGLIYLAFNLIRGLIRRIRG